MIERRTGRSAGRRQPERLRTPLRFAPWVLCLLMTPFAFADDPASNGGTPIKLIPLGDTLLSLPTSHIPGSGSWEIKFTHRFNQSLDQGSFSDQVHSLWGLDSNADVAIGGSYTVRQDLEVSFLRSNALDDIELGAKYLVMQQAPALPVSLALRGGVDWRTEKDLLDRSSLFAQAIVSRSIGSRVEVFAIPTIVTNAGRVVNGQSSGALFRHAVNVPLGAALQIHDGLSVIGELTPKNRDLPSDMHSSFAWALGLKRAVGGHYFEILLTNSNATHADQYVTSTYMGAPLNRGDIHLGFNIERRFGR